MWPGPRDPDFGSFVAQVARELERRGHEVDRAVVDHRGGTPAKHARLLADVVRARRPDVAFAHFLVPAGLAAVAARAPLVAMAHGQDVRNAQASRAVRAATALVVRRAGAVLANSRYLAGELSGALPAAAGRLEVIDCGVDLERFRPAEPGPARARLGLPAGGPVILFVGTLTERKNVLRLRDAVAALGRGTLVLVGEGPLRGELAGRPGVVLAGAVPHAEVAEWIAACDLLCLPSLVEPLGQVVLEALASARSVVATRVGGPAELVPPGAGVLVDPLDVRAIRDGLEAALALGTPNPAARAAAEPHDVRRQAARMEAVLARVARAAAGGASRPPRSRS
jgi:glycosyltransferase involved in cell wall biosynthesis